MNVTHQHYFPPRKNERLFKTRKQYYRRIYAAIDDGTMPGYDTCSSSCLYGFQDVEGQERHCVAGLLCPDGELPPKADCSIKGIPLNKDYFLSLLPDDMQLTELYALQECHDYYAASRPDRPSWEDSKDEIKAAFQQLEASRKWEEPDEDDED